MKKILLPACAFAVLFSAALLPTPSLAQYDSGVEVSPSQETLSSVDILPAKSISGIPENLPDNEATHPAINLTPDRSELVRLDTNAASVIIGNPAHVSVLAETPRLLVLNPQIAGATYLTVLDNDGNVIMSRHIIVGAASNNQQGQYVRIRRSCATSRSENCQPTQVYYCPDTCHAVQGNSATQTSGTQTSGGSSSGQHPSGGVNDAFGQYGTNNDDIGISSQE